MVMEERLTIGSIIVSAIFGVFFGVVAAGLVYLVGDDGTGDQLTPLQHGAVVTGFVLLSGVWIRLATDELRQSFRMGACSGGVAVLLLDAIGVPNWGLVSAFFLVGIIFFKLHQKRNEVGDFGDFFNSTTKEDSAKDEHQP